MKSLLVISALYQLATALNICEYLNVPGNACANNKTPVYCLKVLDTFKQLELPECTTGYVCNDLTGTCVKSNSYSQPSDYFDCQQVGTFPDPLNRKTFHLCYSDSGSPTTVDRKNSTNTSGALINLAAPVAIKKISVQCPGDLVFSPRTDTCSLRFDREWDYDRQWYCSHSGNVGSWRNNENIFYICEWKKVAAAGGGEMVLYPKMFRCPAGERFTGEECESDALCFSNGICMDRRVTLTGWKFGKPILDQFKIDCPDRGIYAHPADCEKYYFCDFQLNAKLFSCPKGQYFEPTLNICTHGACIRTNMKYAGFLI